MKKLAILAACLALSSCDKPLTVKVEQAENTKPPEPVARWAIVPAPGTTEMKADTIYTAVWRLDTKTGGLEFCSYSERPPFMAAGKVVNLTAVACSDTAKAYPAE